MKLLANPESAKNEICTKTKQRQETFLPTQLRKQRKGFVSDYVHEALRLLVVMISYTTENCDNLHLELRGP